MDDSVSTLDSALSAQIEVMREWVAVAQREQVHLLAIEPEGIHACVEERHKLTEEMAEAIESVHATISDLRNRLGITDAKPATVSTIAPYLDSSARERIEERVLCLESLGQAMLELNAINMLHAQRGLNIVEGYTAVLTASDPVENGSPGYNKRGRTQRASTKSRWARSI